MINNHHFLAYQEGEPPTFSIYTASDVYPEHVFEILAYIDAVVRSDPGMPPVMFLISHCSQEDYSGTLPNFPCPVVCIFYPL